MYGPTVVVAKELEESAEPGTLRVSDAAHDRLVHPYPWQRLSSGLGRRTATCWLLRAEGVPAEAVRLAKERSGRGAFLCEGPEWRKDEGFGGEGGGKRNSWYCM